MRSTKPSRTASKIARFVLLLDATPRFAGLLPSGSAAAVEAILRASGTIRPAAIDVMRQPRAQRLAASVEAWAGRGQILWFGLRKRWFADAVEAAIADGTTQLLVVGARFDPLTALVAQRHPGVLCVEIAAPKTAAAKRTGLSGAGLERVNLHVCGIDLASTPLEEARGTTPWRSDARSVVVAEGLLMYLAEAAVTGFLTSVRRSCAPGSRLALSCMDVDDAGRPRLGTRVDGTIRLGLRLAGESFRWGAGPADLRAFLADAGYRMLAQPDLAALRERYLDPLELRDEPLSPYEHLALAEVLSGPEA